MLGLRDLGLERDRAADDLVRRRLVDAARVVGAAPDAGQVVCEIGVAPVKPAEFVIFRLSQFSGGASLTE